MSAKTLDTLEVLPEDVRAQLAAITALFVASPAVEMLLLFGSFARGDFVVDLETGYRSDFDLLAVTQSAKDAADHMLFGELEERAKQIAGKTPISLIRHDITELNREIRMGQFFFADIVREGVLLYDSRHVQLAKPKAATLQERFELTRRYFKTWYASASSLWTVSHHIPFAERRMAAFLLHQAAERYFHAVTLVYDGYKHRTHNLELLAGYVEPHHALLQPSLARVDDYDKYFFSLLKRAYIEARYSQSYDVNQAELNEMRARVHDFAKRVRLACIEKLSEYFGFEAVGELPDVPSAVDLNELPPPPEDTNDKEAIELWQQVVGRFVRQIGEEREARGRDEGRQEGRIEGHEDGLKEGEARTRARAIYDVLVRRNIPMSAEQSESLLACRDEALLATYWERVLTVQSVDEMLAK